MTKKDYMKPTMIVVKIQQQRVICASDNGVNTGLQDSQVNSAWSREGGNRNSLWDDEE